MNGIEIEQFWVDEYWAWMERPVRHIDDIPPWLTVSNKPYQDLTDVRTIVAKHLPENEPLPKRNWLQRWLTNPEPDEQPVEHRIVTADTPASTGDTWDHYGAVETPYADSLMDRLSEAHLNAVGEARREAARDGVFVAIHHLEKHLDGISNDTMTDTVARAAIHDCIDILRKLRRDMRQQDSGGA